MIGNVKLMREALEEALPWLVAIESKETPSVRETINKIHKALDEPPRNCDVFGFVEGSLVFDKFPSSEYAGCKIIDGKEPWFAEWLYMPYKKST